MRSVLALAAATVLASVLAGTVVAMPGAAMLPPLDGASQLYPVADRYEPGEVATLVGYTGRGDQGWVENGPFFGYLTPTAGTGAGLALGVLSLAETGRDGWRALRVSVSFPVPDDVEPGEYTVSYCNDPCTTGLGALTEGVLAIGVDPEAPIVRVWSIDEPEIANVSEDAVIAGPGYEASASVIRAGGLLVREPAQVPPAPVSPAPVSPVASVPPSPTPAPAVAPPGPAAGVSAGWLLFGTGFAAACVLSVLMALRQGRSTGGLAIT